MNVYEKDPNAVLDYQFDWSDWLADGETIQSHTITVTPGEELTVDSSGVNSGVVRVWLSAGNAKKTYLVACKIVTDNSPTRTDERTILVKCFER